MPDTAAIIETSDALHAKEDVHANFETLDNAYEDGNRNPEILWRLGRSCYDMAQESTDKEVQHKFIDRGLGLVKEALDKQPDNFAAHKWYGIMLGSKGDFIATKEKIANAYIIRDAFAKAIELNPTDPTSQHCLGKWCWKVLQIGWIERQAASLLFGTPPTSSYEECEKYLLESAKLNPKQLYNCTLLGDLNYQQSKYDEAKKWYSAALECPTVTENHKRQHQEAQDKLAKC